MKPDVHIYPLSRLVNASAPRWVKLLQDIETGKDRAFAYYLPSREGIALLTAKKGQGSQAILAQVIRRAESMAGPRVATDNERAYKNFEAHFLPKIGKLKKSLLHEAQSGVAFEGVNLLGAPHMVVTDRDGNERYVVLLAADWEKDDLFAYLELLRVIVDKQFNGTAASIWCMDLRTGKTVKFLGSNRMRNRCIACARLYARVARA